MNVIRTHVGGEQLSTPMGTYLLQACQYDFPAVYVKHIRALRHSTSRFNFDAEIGLRQTGAECVLIAMDRTRLTG